MNAPYVLTEPDWSAGSSLDIHNESFTVLFLYFYLLSCLLCFVSVLFCSATSYFYMNDRFLSNASMSIMHHGNSPFIRRKISPWMWCMCVITVMRILILVYIQTLRSTYTEIRFASFTYTIECVLTYNFKHTLAHVTPINFLIYFIHNEYFARLILTSY